MIAIGPMSSEVIEAVFRYSHITHRPLELIASKNQIDYKGGYVNGWNTQQYMEYIKTMRSIYLDATVLIARDHCGPGFNGSEDLTDTFKTIEEDIKRGFDIIHIDFCNYQGDRQQALHKAGEAITYARKRNPRMLFEIGTDEIRQVTSLAQIRANIEFFIDKCTPEYYVVNTGSLVMEDQQVGVFNFEKTRQASMLLKEFNLKLKEHNVDYSTPSQIQQRRGVVDAINVAPELGVRQTEKTIQLANQYGVDLTAFLKVAYKSNKWKKWLQYTSPDDKGFCSVLAGHYVFNTKEYSRVYSNLSEVCDVKEELISTAIEVIDKYAMNF